jgi:biopolymer transport protein ExbD
MRKPSDRKRSSVGSMNEELHITPVMNLFMILIPFLLMSAVFVQISIINTSLPFLTQNENQSNAPLEKRIILTCVINEQGFILKGSPVGATSVINANYLKNEGKIIKKNENGAYNFNELNQILYRIKQDYPREDTIFLMPEPFIKYEIVVQTMDVARILIEKQNGKKKITNLFSNAIIAGNI